MRVGIVVNVMDSEVAGQTTYRLAANAADRGHETWLMSAGKFSYEPDGRVRAYARKVQSHGSRVSESLTGGLRGNDADETWITVDDLDILLLRSNPSVQHAWAQTGAINFGRIAMRHGVIVLNDPNGLAKAMNKLYLQTFPNQVWPRTLITRSESRIANFARREGKVVIKPLQGSGGKNVFVIRPDDTANMDQIVRAVRRDGYVVAQEYLPAAAEGDTRLFLMNGLPLQYKGKYAAFRRIRTGEDIRSNIHAGGRLRRAVVDDTMLRLAEIVRPKLVQDGMFLVGLDIVGNKIMEINIFSPGGLGSAQKFEKVDFSDAVVDALERKAQYSDFYNRSFSNVDLATL